MELLEFIGVEDAGAIIAIITLTGVIKKYFNIKERAVPLIPLVLGLFAGILTFFAKTNLSEFTWYQIIAQVILTGLIYTGVAGTGFKLWKTSIMGK